MHSGHHGGSTGATGGPVEHGSTSLRPLPVQLAIAHDHSVASGGPRAWPGRGGEDEDVRPGVVHARVLHRGLLLAAHLDHLSNLGYFLSIFWFQLESNLFSCNDDIPHPTEGDVHSDLP